LPEEVLGALNQAYQMEQQGGMYLTIWYGVYHLPSSRLRYASAGHPPPILVRGPRGQRGEASLLRAHGPILGMLPTVCYRSEECVLAAPARLFLFSDGVYEIHQPDDTMLPFEAFEEVLTRAVPEGVSELDELLRFARHFQGAALLKDDFSIVKLTI
jgi:serine phosphatase RsbU (regulator of sigma subunit)